jgi:hypothetical protein
MRILFILLCLSNYAWSQSDTIIHLKQRISYYENGNMKKLETVRTDSCRLYAENFDDYVYSNNCKDGLIKEWYSNGKLKLEGEYKLKENSWAGNECYDSYPIGIWYEYDTLGNIEKMTRYHNNQVFVKKAKKDSVIEVQQDSLWIKIKEYLSPNCYIIKRKKENQHLFFAFPMIDERVNVWRIYDYKRDLLMKDDMSYEHLPHLFSFRATDAGTNQCNSFDFARLKNGRYYVYYYGFIGNLCHELEIILEDL